MPIVGATPTPAPGVTLPVGWRFGAVLYDVGAITWGLVDADGVEWHMETFDGWWDGPEVVGQSTKIPDDHGLFLGPAVYGERLISVAGKIVAPSTVLRDAARRKLGQAMPVGALVTVVVSGSPQLTTQGRLSGRLRSLPVNEQAFNVAFTLLCPDPRKYVVNPPVFELRLPSPALLGADLPNDLPLALPANPAGFAGAVVTNLGDVTAPWTARINGPVILPQLNNLTTGRTFKVNLTLGVGEWLDVDAKAKTVTLNGSVSRSGLIAHGSSWWGLAPGVNEVRFTSDFPPPGGEPVCLFTPQSAWS